MARLGREFEGKENGGNWREKGRNAQDEDQGNANEEVFIFIVPYRFTRRRVLQGKLGGVCVGIPNTQIMYNVEYNNNC